MAFAARCSRAIAHSLRGNRGISPRSQSLVSAVRYQSSVPVAANEPRKRSETPVVATCRPGATFVSLYLDLKGTRHVLYRERIGVFENTLKRLAALAEVKVGGEHSVALLNGSGANAGKPKRPGTLNVDAFQDGDVVVIGDTEYPVVVDPPTVLGVVMPNYVAQGTEIRPTLQTEHMADETQVSFVWRRIADGAAWDSGPVVSRERTYTPTQDDVGYRLALSVSPVQRDGISMQPIVSCPICPVDAPMPEPGYAARAQQTPSLFPVDSKRFRVVSYNVLAEQYANDTLQYPYCEKKALSSGYRDAILTRELCAYNADIFCLQEMEDTRFHAVVKPTLSGYDGELHFKYNLREGLATFWRRDRFDFRDVSWHLLQENLHENPALAEFSESLPPRVMGAMKLRNSILQLVHLSSKSDGRDLIIANTHLFYHPLADHLRMVMAYTIMVLLTEYRREVMRFSNTELAPTIIFAGDFNSTPERAVHEIISTGSLSAVHPNRISHGSRDRITSHCDHDLGFGAVLPSPDVPYSNYTGDFVGTLDNIYYTRETARMLSTVPISEEVMKEFTALPSVRFPSDHIPVIADFEWTS